MSSGLFYWNELVETRKKVIKPRKSRPQPRKSLKKARKYYVNLSRSTTFN